MELMESVKESGEIFYELFTVYGLERTIYRLSGYGSRRREQAMIIFQQIRNATVKLKYPSVSFMIDPWLMDVCAPEEREQAVATRSFIPKPICPLPAAAEELIADVDFFLLTHIHPDHFSVDYLSVDLPFVCQNEKDAHQLENMGFSHVQYFDKESLSLDS